MRYACTTMAAKMAHITEHLEALITSTPVRPAVMVAA